MRHHNRWDLPKGHVDPGETDFECALRELVEETSIEAGHLEVDAEFEFRDYYLVTAGKRKPVVKQKELVIFLGTLQEDIEIQVTEHIGFEWFEWQPPHQIQKKTIDPLLESVARFWTRQKKTNH